MWSRGSVLGEPDGLVVAAVFGVFEPGLIAQGYDAARASWGRRTSAPPAKPGSSPRCAPRWAVRRRPRRWPGGCATRPERPAWPAVRCSPAWPACPGRRTRWPGSGRPAPCCVSCAGTAISPRARRPALSGLEANLLTELQVGWPPQSYTATRGWPPEAMDLATARLRDRGLLADTALTGAGASLRADLEAATDRQLEPVIDALGPGLKELLPQLAGWSGQIIERGWFPPDPYKRASG